VGASVDSLADADARVAGCCGEGADLARAAERGEVRPDRVTPRIARLPGDLLRQEILHQRGDAPDAVLTEILDEVFLPLVAQASASGRPCDNRPGESPGPT
jgi:hypothetical protein